MKNGVELLPSELFVPIEFRQILGHEIAAVAGQVFEIAGAEIVDHGEARLRKFLLQSKRQVRADKAGAAGHDEIKRRIRGRHREIVERLIDKS